MACSLTAASCFRRYIVARGPDLSLRTGKDGWYSMPCPVGRHGKPLRLQAGANCHVFYTDLGGCPEPEVFGALVGLGVPGECLKRPKGSKPSAPQPKTSGSEEEGLADLILSIAFGEGTATERLIRIALAAADGDRPDGPMVDVFAERLRVSPASIYRATAEDRRKDRKW
jgi:hypothetical protein